MNITFEGLKIIEEPYNLKKIKVSMVVYKASKKSRVKRDQEIKMFLMLGRITVKQINIFSHMLRYTDNVKIMITKDELVAESWLVFHKCVERADLNKMGSFLFFYNTALNRELTRLRNRLFNNMHNNTNYLTDHFGFFQGSGQSHEESGEQNIPAEESHTRFHLMFHQLIGWGLDMDEIRIVASRISNERVIDFIKSNYDIDQNKYYNLLNSIREKIKNINKYDFKYRESVISDKYLNGSWTKGSTGNGKRSVAKV